MKTIHYFWSILLVSLLAGCAGNPDPATPTTFNDFCGMSLPEGQNYPKLYEWEKSQETRVSLEGYLALPTGFGLASSTFTILLYEKPDRQGKSVRVSMKLGSGRNRLTSPGKKYQLNDLQVQDSKGEKVGITTKVRVHGKRSVIVERKKNEAIKVSSCFMNVDLVETI